MAVEIINQPYPHFTDDSGEELDSGYIYIGTAGADPESSPITVYWDKDLTVPAVQPLRVFNGNISRSGSSAGSPSRVWVGTDYSIKIKDRREVAIYASLSNNNERAVTIIDAASITYNQGGTGAVDTTVRAKLQETVSALDKGLDNTGVADSTAALLVAISDIASTADPYRGEPPILDFPDGTYRISSSVAIGAKSIHLRALGDVTLVMEDASLGFDIGNASYLTNLSEGLFRFKMSGFKITGAAGQTVIRNRGYRTIQLEDLYVRDGAIGLDTEGAYADSYAINCRWQSQTAAKVKIQVRNNLFRFEKNSALSGGGIGFWMPSTSADVSSTAENESILFDGCDASGVATGWDIEGKVKSLRIVGGYTESNTGKDIIIRNAAGIGNKDGILISANHFDGTIGTGIDIGTDAGGTEISGLNFTCNDIANNTVTFIGGNRFVDSFYGPNGESASTVTMPSGVGFKHGNSGVLAESMPLYRDAPQVPFGVSQTTGKQGEIRYEDGYQYMKTEGGWQSMQMPDFDDSNNLLRPLPTGTTPEVVGLMHVRTSNSGATTVTELNGADIGGGVLTGGVNARHMLYIVGGDGGGTTVADSAQIALAGSVNFTLGDDDCLVLMCTRYANNKPYWVEVSRSNN